MEVDKEEAKEKIAELVKKYENLNQSEVKSFHEAKTKQGFIEPLFRALGWNFEDTNEVAPEETASGGRVDYAFKLNGVSRFYMEAKPLRADLTRDEYAKQAITYAYTKGVTWAVLTDFEGIQVYNAQTGSRFINLTYDKYLTDFEDLWLLSKESFQINALNEKAEKYGALRVRLGIEQRLFTQLRQWREELSTQLHSYNKKLSVKQIDEVIQRLFNRLIFIRTCEDRGIENKVLLGAVHEWVRTKRKGELIEILQSIFRDFDGFYDSDLFQHHLADEISVESDTIENIISGLYEVQGGMAYYDFSLIDADVLGAVYEQYLGHIANIVKQRAKEAQAKMDLGLPYDETIELTAKKQRRKEHGIYYTPEFVTDYIVKETVGRFLKEHSPAEVRNIKILDPACGSGSFLIRAFDELLKYYGDQKTSKSVNQIDAADRISILQSNIFGIDLDIQAVEITRLNLLLRSLAKRETLPGLKNNIKEGNSLISGTEEELIKYFGSGWKDKKPFNWEHEFKDIIDNGGFDVVIGNPPYIRSRNLDDLEQEFFRTQYEVAHERYDIYTIFIEHGIRILKAGGRLGFIIPNKFLAARYATKLRQYLLKSCTIETIVDISNVSVFKEAAVYPCILIARKEPNERIRQGNMVKTLIADEPMAIDNVSGYGKVPQTKLIVDKNYAFQISNTGKMRGLLAKIVEGSDPLGEIANINEGIHTGNVRNKLVFNAPHGTNPKKVVGGKNVSRYYLHWQGTYVDYDTSIIDRAAGEYGSLRDEAIFDCTAKIVIRDIGIRPTATLDRQRFYLLNTLYSLRTRDSSVDIRFLLGLLNSSLFAFLFRNLYENAHIGGDFLRFKPFYLKQLPIHRLNFNNPTEKEKNNEMIALVDKILMLNEKVHGLSNFDVDERQGLEKQRGQPDQAIDNLVYDLYGLTESEKKIVESSLSQS